MVGYLQIDDKGSIYTYLLNPIVSEMAIGTEGHYHFSACLLQEIFLLCSFYLTM